MTLWSKDELHKIAQADDLHISPFRDDGVTYGTPTWIWSVAETERRTSRRPQRSCAVRLSTMFTAPGA